MGLQRISTFGFHETLFWAWLLRNNGEALGQIYYRDTRRSYPRTANAFVSTLWVRSYARNAPMQPLVLAEGT